MQVLSIFSRCLVHSWNLILDQLWRIFFSFRITIRSVFLYSQRQDSEWLAETSPTASVNSCPAGSCHQGPHLQAEGQLGKGGGSRGAAPLERSWAPERGGIEGIENRWASSEPERQQRNQSTSERMQKALRVVKGFGKRKNRSSRRLVYQQHLSLLVFLWQWIE